MTKLYRDVRRFWVDFSSGKNHWLYRAFFKYPDGTIAKTWSFKGIDEMKEGLRKLENGTIKVVRNKQYSSLEYEIAELREKELKKFLQKEIEALENDYTCCDDETEFSCSNLSLFTGEILQH